MFHRRHNKIKPTPHTKPHQDLIAVVSSEHLLAEERRAELINKIRAALPINNARFDAIGRGLIQRLIQHSQTLPDTFNNYYTQPAGLLDYALNRAEAALQLFRQYVVMESDVWSEIQTVWGYALFSASILQGIGKLQLDYRVERYDSGKQRIDLWNPLLGDLTIPGGYYRYTLETRHNDDLRCRLNVLLAQRLMPADGFALIASHAEVLSVWLALLHEDWESAGTLGAILIRADAIAIQRSLEGLIHLLGTGERAGRVRTFIDSAPEGLTDKEQLTGIEFIQWLMQKLESGQLMVNKAPLLMVPGGMLMSSDIFQLFVQEHPEYKNWQAIQNGFLALGLHAMDANRATIARVEGESGKHMFSGVVLANYAVAFPEQVRFYRSVSGKISMLSATDFIARAHSGLNAQAGALHLAADGQWQKREAAAAVTPPLHPGQSRRV